MSQTQIGDLLKQAKGEERFWTLSNICSMLRILLVPVIVRLIIPGRSASNIAALGLIGFAYLLDLFDGYYARSRRQVTRIGKILDPVADKLLANAVIFTLVFWRHIPLWFASFVAFRDLCILIFGYTLFRGRNLVPTSNRWGKSAVFFLGLLIFFSVGCGHLKGMATYQYILIGICLSLIFGSGVNYLNLFINEIKSHKSLVNHKNEGNHP